MFLEFLAKSHGFARVSFGSVRICSKIMIISKQNLEITGNEIIGVHPYTPGRLIILLL